MGVEHVEKLLKKKEQIMWFRGWTKKGLAKNPGLHEGGGKIRKKWERRKKNEVEKEGER